MPSTAQVSLAQRQAATEVTIDQSLARYSASRQERTTADSGQEYSSEQDRNQGSQSLIGWLSNIYSPAVVIVPYLIGALILGF